MELQSPLVPCDGAEKVEDEEENKEEEEIKEEEENKEKVEGGDDDDGCKVEGQSPLVPCNGAERGQIMQRNVSEAEGTSSSSPSTNADKNKYKNTQNGKHRKPTQILHNCD